MAFIDPCTPRLERSSASEPFGLASSRPVASRGIYVANPTPPSPDMPIDYLQPDVPRALPWHEVPLVRATPVSLAGYGELVDDPEDFPVEIVTWPALGWRPVDP